jgi:hypothetical protein
MRILLISALLCCGTAVQDPPPAASPASKLLTPAEIELIEHYLHLRGQESKPHDEAIRRIWQKYDDLIRKALPEEKHRAANLLMGSC